MTHTELYIPDAGIVRVQGCIDAVTDVRAGMGKFGRKIGHGRGKRMERRLGAFSYLGHAALRVGPGAARGSELRGEVRGVGRDCWAGGDLGVF